MALVIRSKRDFDFIPKTQSNLGPGEYEKEFNKTSNSTFNNYFPFNSSKERLLHNLNKENDELGPGSYFKENNNSFKQNNFNINNINEILGKKFYEINLFNLMKKKKYLQIKEKKSLIIDKNNSQQVNNINIKNNINYKDNNKTHKNFIKIIPTTLTKNRTKSIPSTEYFLEYDSDKYDIPIILQSNKNKNLKIDEKNIKSNIKWNKMIKKNILMMKNYLKKDNIKKNILKNKAFNMTQNNNTNYEILGSNCSTNNSTNTQFNKQLNISLTDRSSKFMITNKYLNSIESLCNSNNNSFLNNNYKNQNKSLYINKTLSPKVMSSKIKSFLHSFYSKNVDKHNKNEFKKLDINNINNLSDSDIEELVYKTLLKDEPGPGYYINNSVFDKYRLIPKNNNNNKKYNFGSNLERNLNLLYKNTGTNIGPGTYFKNDSYKNIQKTYLSSFNKTKKLIKKNLNSPKNLNDIFSKTEISQNIGPGKYEFKSQFTKKQKYFSGPFEKRFFSIIKKIDPGPGEYLSLNKWGEKNKRTKISKYIKKFKNENINIKKEGGRDYYINKTDSPDGGLYNPQILNSIEYNMIFKNNKISNMKAPFFSSKNKFSEKCNSTSNFVGPGSYINIHNSISPKNNRIKNQMKIKYNLITNDIERNKKIKDLYNKNKQKIKNNIGPGTYDNYNYFNWNKRSFNILYV